MMAASAPIPAEAFYAADQRRRDSRQWDNGFFRSEDGEKEMQITWLEATGEVCALIGGGRNPDGFILLGTAPNFDCIAAVLIDRPGRDASIGWVAERLAEIPTDPGEIESMVAAYKARIQADTEEGERREVASFEVVDLAELPATDTELAERYLDADWCAIAGLAVDLLEGGVSPHDDEAIQARGAAVLPDDDGVLLWSLFFTPIAIPREATAFIDGRHRTAAMRAAGVRRCVVHTDRGFE
jgi:hypothetical protein